MEKKQGKTHKLVTLFVATALVAATGCSNSAANLNCVDQNNDGYCDNGSGSTSSSGYYRGGSSSGKSGTVSGSSGISQGSSSHGGIGSSSGSSSG